MPTEPSPAAELVARFRRQQPLRGGSLIVTLFGDAILPRGGAIALGSLIELAAPFGLNDRLVRTATSRLAKEGWLTGRKAGKLSEYHLSMNGRERFAEATERIYSEPDTRWSRSWTLAVAPPMRAALRKQIRDELIWRGFGEIANGVFAHPEYQPQALHREGPDLLSQVMIFSAALAESSALERVVRLGWDLKDLGQRYQRFVQRFEGVRQKLQHRRALSDLDCFVVRTLLIHEYRRLHLRDPLLPAELLPAAWPGSQAAALSRDIYGSVVARSENYLSRVALTLDGPLPPLEASFMQRFGGIKAT